MACSTLAWGPQAGFAAHSPANEFLGTAAWPCLREPALGSTPAAFNASSLSSTRRTAKGRGRGCLSLALSAPAPAGSPTVAPMASLNPAPAILINGAAGKMGRAVAEAAIQAGVPLAPWGITGPGLPRETLEFSTQTAPPGTQDAPLVKVEVVPAEERDDVLDRALQRWPGLIVVDYTLPKSVNSNAEWYVQRRVPFVMGTTGGDRARLLREVQESGVYAVIAAQMGKQVVAFIAAMETLARESPGAFSGYQLKVVESHQSTKVDTSGTAKDVVAAFQKLGVKFDVEEIEKVRDAALQVSRMGVPPDYLNAHAFHTYQLLSPDGTVSFQFQHNVCGRSIYAHGAVDAVLFLHKQIVEKAPQTLYNMVDVLKAGSMR